MCCLAELDVLLSLVKGTYEIHVAFDAEREQLTLSVASAPAKEEDLDQEPVDGLKHHPLLRAIVGRGSATTTLEEHYDAAMHRVTAASKLEFVTFLRLLSSAGEFHIFAQPLAFQVSPEKGLPLLGGQDRLAQMDTIPPRVLIIAGSDSGGGAGIQADLKACTNLGVFSSSAVTAVTVQNTQGVHGIHAIPVNDIADQITCVLDDIGADVVKVREDGRYFGSRKRTWC